MVGEIFSAAAGLGTSIFGSALNYNMQKKQLAYQKEQDAIQRQREDTAYQRTVKDMRAAGLNPLMMTSTDDSAPAVAGTLEAPQFDTSGISDAVSSLGTALGSLPQQINQFRLDRQRLKVQDEQLKQAQLQNKYDSSTLKYRVRSQAFQTIAGMYDTLDKRSKSIYNNFFGINDNMTDKERYLQIARKVLGFDKGTYNGNGSDYRELEHTLDLENFDRYASPSKMTKDDLKSSISSLLDMFNSDSSSSFGLDSLFPKKDSVSVPSDRNDFSVPGQRHKELLENDSQHESILSRLKSAYDKHTMSKEAYDKAVKEENSRYKRRQDYLLGR